MQISNKRERCHAQAGDTKQSLKVLVLRTASGEGQPIGHWSDMQEECVLAGNTNILYLWNQVEWGCC